MKVTKKYAILVNSCDEYSDTWPMFTFLFKKMWPNEYPKIYLNTETKDFYDSELDICCIHDCLESKNDHRWGFRLRKVLMQLEYKYILMMLDDFYYEKSIKVDEIDKCITYMEKNPNITAFQLVPAGECHNMAELAPKGQFPGFVKRKKYGLFKIIAGPTLWRKDDLIRLTKNNDSPWEWEYFGSFRTWLFGSNFYCWTSLDNPIFMYDIDHGGAVHRGKWVGYKVRELANKFNFPINYGNREIEEDWMANAKMVEPIPVIKKFISIIRNRIKILVNIFFGAKLRLIMLRKLYFSCV